MKWIGIIQFYDELKNGNLPRAVRSMRRICNEIIGYDDGSTDGGGAWGDANLDACIHGASNDWDAEIQHKHAMLEEAKRRGADWVLWLDADEELSPQAVAGLRKLEGKEGVTGICIPEINLWRDEHNYRIDSQYGNAGFLRAWRVTPLLKYSDEQVWGRGLHLPQFPKAAQAKLEGLQQPDHELGIIGEPIIHHSWSSPEKIQAKYERYKAKGQSGWSLDRLLDSQHAVRVKVRPEWFWPSE